MKNKIVALVLAVTLLPSPIYAAAQGPPEHVFDRVPQHAQVPEEIPSGVQPPVELPADRSPSSATQPEPRPQVTVTQQGTVTVTATETITATSTEIETEVKTKIIIRWYDRLPKWAAGLIGFGLGGTLAGVVLLRRRNRTLNEVALPPDDDASGSG